MAKNKGTIRYATVLENGGRPEIYLPLGDPKQDHDFMRAVSQSRVLSVKQEPTGNKRDFGVIDFVAEKYVTYLVFSKSLAQFKGQRVVGIKYESLREAKLSTTGTAPKIAKAGPKTRTAKKRKPEPKEFRAIVRLEAVQDVPVSVMALNEKEGRAKALETAQMIGDWKQAALKTKLLKITSEPKRD